MRMMNPSMMVSRLDPWFLELAVAGIMFCRLPWGFWIFRVFIEQRVGPGGTQGGHNPPGRAWASWRAEVGTSHHGPTSSFCPIKIHREVSWHLDFV